MRKLVCGSSLVGLLLCVGLQPAAAQVVSDPNEIRSCLCQEQFVTALQGNVATRHLALESSQRDQNSLASQVATRRAQINVYDNAELDAFKKLLQQRDAAIAATAAEAQRYDEAAERYNQAVAAYNATCAGRSYDQTVLRQVQTTLACPRPSIAP